MKVFMIFLVLIGISLSYSNLPDTEARTIAPLHIALEDETIKQNSFITADGVPVIAIQKGETISFQFTVNPRVSDPLPVNFFHSIESAMPDTRKSTLPNMKIEFEPYYMILKPDESQILNVTITTLNYTHHGEHRVTVTAQYPQGETLLSTGFDVLIVNEKQYENPNSNSKYPVPGGGIIAEKYPVKQQYKMGLKFENLKCNEGHVLIQKYDGTPACVTESTKTKLVERGWTTNNKLSEFDFDSIKSNIENIGYDICSIRLDDNAIVIDLNKIFEGTTQEKQIISQIPGDTEYEIVYHDGYTDYFINNMTSHSCD